MPLLPRQTHYNKHTLCNSVLALAHLEVFKSLSRCPLFSLVFSVTTHFPDSRRLNEPLTHLQDTKYHSRESLRDWDWGSFREINCRAPLHKAQHKPCAWVFPHKQRALSYVHTDRESCRRLWSPSPAMILSYACVLCGCVRARVSTIKIFSCSLVVVRKPAQAWPHLSFQSSLKFPFCKLKKKKKTSGEMSLYRVSDIERSISGPHVTHSNEEDVDEGPDAQSSETEELAQSLSPLSQIKAVCSEPTQRDAAWNRESCLYHFSNDIHIKYNYFYF